MSQGDEQLVELFKIIESQIKGVAQNRFIHALVHGHRLANGLPIPAAPSSIFAPPPKGAFHPEKLDPDLYTEDGGVWKGRLQERLGLASLPAKRLVDPLLNLSELGEPVLIKRTHPSDQKGKNRTSYTLTARGYEKLLRAVCLKYYWVDCSSQGRPPSRPLADDADGTIAISTPATE